MSYPIAAVWRLRAVVLIAGIPCIGAAQALEREPPAGIDWQCVQEYDAYFHILCEPRIAPSADPAADAPHADKQAGTQPLPAATHAMLPATLRKNAPAIATRTWRVPLYNLPFDAASVTGLLKSVLCVSATPCTVAYHTTRGIEPRSMQAARSPRW